MGKIHRILNWFRNRLFFLQSSLELGSAFLSCQNVPYLPRHEYVKSCQKLGRYRLPKKTGKRKYNQTGKRESKKS